MFSARTNWKLTPNALTQAQQKLAAEGREVLDLSASNPTQIGLNFDTATILESLASPAALDYSPHPKGLRAAREAVAGYYREQHDIFSADPENIFLTTSTSEAYSFIFRLLCNVDDQVLVPKPSYPLFDFLADIEDVKLVPYPLVYDHGWQIDFSSLFKMADHHTRAVVVVHPNNPTGSYARAEEIASLNAFCRENNLALIIDEVFLDYAHDGAARPSFAGNQDVLTFTLSGLSKISALPQMKLAWAIVTGPAELVGEAVARVEVIADTFLSLNTPVQLAAPVLLQQRKNIQPLLLDRLRTNLEELNRQLSRQTLCRRLDLEGGWYAVLRVPVTQSDEELAIRILTNCSVLVHPGHFYDFPNDGYLVLSLITPSSVFREGLSRLLAEMA